MNSRLQSQIRLIFKGLYYIVSFFIFIGEVTQWPFKLLLRLLIKIWQILGRVNSRLTIQRREAIKKSFNAYYSFQNIVKEKINLFRNNFRVKFNFLYLTREIWLRVKYFILGTLVTLIVVIFYQSYLFVKDLPSPNNIGKVNYPLSTHIYDRNDVLLYEIYSDQNRTQVALDELPKYVIQSTIAIEDKDFYKHNGVAWISGVLRAVKESLFNKNIQGGSTITQQLVKSALLTPERTIERKVKEVILALWTEKIYSKNEILEMYLNQVPYGGSSYGIEEATKTYFGKSAKELSLEESALLAGLPQAPSVYSPYTNPEAALSRRNDVLDAMKKQGYIDENTRNVAKNTKLIVLPPKTSIYAPHFVFYTKSELESYYGIEKVEAGGLKVKTTLDLEIQKEAEKILVEEIEKVKYLNVTNGAILVTRPSTGEILAMVGSVDYFEQPWGAFNVTTALRQPGSSIKPVLYSLALQKEFTAASIIDDSPVIFTSQGTSSYQPVNYDGKFHGKVPLRYALANSFNIPAVKVLNTIGVDKFIDYAQKIGIDTWQDRSRYGLSLSLGGGEVTMVDMAEAFGTLANQGFKLPLNYYLDIKDSSGQTIKEMNPFKIREMDPAISYIISDILSDNQARTWAFGANSALEIPGYKVAVKTGTTDSKKDNWTIGYTPDFLVVVWVGNNDNSPMNPQLASGVTGAAPIWNRMMSYLLKNYSDGNQWYAKPENIVEKVCFFGKKEYFVKGTENKVNCGNNMLLTPTPKR